MTKALNDLATIIMWLVFVAAVVVFGSEALQKLWAEHVRTFEDYLIYYSVEPAKPEMHVSAVEFDTDREVLRSVRVYWSDVLMCRPIGGETYIRYEDYDSGGQIRPPAERSTLRWAWPPEKLPTYDAECYGMFEITIRPHRTEKYKKVRSKSFIVRQTKS